MHLIHFLLPFQRNKKAYLSFKWLDKNKHLHKLYSMSSYSETEKIAFWEKLDFIDLCTIACKLWHTILRPGESLSPCEMWTNEWSVRGLSLTMRPDPSKPLPKSSQIFPLMEKHTFYFISCSANKKCLLNSLLYCSYI